MSIVFILSLLCVCVHVPIQCVAFPHLAANNDGEGKIDIHQHLPEHWRHKRSTDGFPNEIVIEFEAGGASVNLSLKINHLINDDVPVMLQRSRKIINHQVKKEEAVAFYGETKNGSSFMVWHNNDTNPENLFIFFGTFVVGNKLYLIQPPTDGHQSHFISTMADGQPYYSDYVLSPGYIENAKLSSSKRDSNLHRTKRQTISYEVEIFIVADYAVYSFWFNKTTGTTVERSEGTLNNIKQYYAFVLNAINLRYESVTGRGYTISCLYAGIYIADTADAAPFVENHIDKNLGGDRSRADANTVLKSFSDWANTNLAGLYVYDHAMLFTAYDIGSVTNDVFQDTIAGLAYVSQVCSNLRYSISEDDFDAIVAVIAAHELGHSLGASHDGSNNTCGANDSYIMAPKLGRNIRNWIFSTCSLDYFDDFIDLLNNNNCMTTRSSSYNSSSNSKYADDLAGQVYPPDVQCEYIYGKGSVLARKDVDYSTICALMTCVSPNNTLRYVGVTAWEGTTCGIGKICKAGDCVVSADAPTNLTESCLFGDDPTDNVLGTNRTCAELMGTPTTSNKCYTDYYKSRCCQTCERMKQVNVERGDCEYGDKAPWCATLDLRSCYSNDAECCQSCPERALDIPDCKYGDTATSCATLDLRLCYSNDAVCCQSCPDRALDIPDCKYGDTATWCATLDLRLCYSNDAVCCQSCPDRALEIPGCEYGDRATWCATLDPSLCYLNNATCCQSCVSTISTTTKPTTTTPTTTTPTTTTSTTSTPTTTTTTLTTTTPTTTTPTTTTPTTTTTTPTTTTSTTTTPTTTTPTTTAPTTTAPTTTTPTTTTPTTTTPTTTTPTTTTPTTTTPITSTQTTTTPTTTTPTTTTPTTTTPTITTPTTTTPTTTAPTTTTPTLTTPTTTTPTTTTPTTTTPTKTTPTTTTPITTKPMTTTAPTTTTPTTTTPTTITRITTTRSTATPVTAFTATTTPTTTTPSTATPATTSTATSTLTTTTPITSSTIKVTASNAALQQIALFLMCMYLVKHP